MIPQLTDQGLLPLGVHEATLDEVHKVFVDGAPFEPDRRRIFAALEIYAGMLWTELPSAVLWVNGGFVTHKQWAPPADVDVAVLVPPPA